MSHPAVPQYVYSNMAIAHGEDLLYMVVRIWKEELRNPEPICHTDSQTNTELISSALNKSIGITDSQADTLIKEWITAENARS